MEPFGLLNLLKSLLPQTENSAQNPKENADKNGLGFDGANAADGADAAKSENGTPPPKTAQPPVFADPPQNAFLEFVNRHDQRKKNIKNT